MSTRKLILTALLCGLAILIAGGIQLIRIADDKPVSLPTIGEERVVGGVSVLPVEVIEAEGVSVVTLQVRSTEDAVPGALGAWTMVRGATFSPVALPADLPDPVLPGDIATGDLGDCAPLTVPAQPTSGTAFVVGLCRVAFAAPGGGARYLAFKRGTVEARWALDA